MESYEDAAVKVCLLCQCYRCIYSFFGKSSLFINLRVVHPGDVLSDDSPKVRLTIFSLL
uniref:Ovule protein n=1 Tax=Heterorhabditis bacteriophora TaxID=37862 RepID=A0A1I7WIZ9_HETBA